ncbi:MAG: methyltransferase domain-containing protein [Candidatus Nanopelagicales bacterium]|nr:methyltransferase domain-containing protein [Candidatus Nanopelagicales bacterium]
MKVTLADGVFDPLHSGHLAYLDACRALGDPVVVQVSPQLKRADCIPRHTRVELLRRLGYQVVTYDTTLEAILAIQPVRYCKGSDWKSSGVPTAEREACLGLNVTVVYINVHPQESSTAMLTRWADRTAEMGATLLDDAAALQRMVPFDADAQGYGEYGKRRLIEGKHPQILAELCAGQTILDVGCGPGHLVQMLREYGALATGVDPYMVPTVPGCLQLPVSLLVDQSADVVVCREVLEHLPVREVGPFLAHLFRVAKSRVYLTTRFHPKPAHPFDLTDECVADPSHITVLPQPFVRALCVTMGGVRDRAWEQKLDWQHKSRVLVYRVTR